MDTEKDGKCEGEGKRENEKEIEREMLGKCDRGQGKGWDAEKRRGKKMR
jgi:hypothetical protein